MKKEKRKEIVGNMNANTKYLCKLFGGIVGGFTTIGIILETSVHYKQLENLRETVARRVDSYGNVNGHLDEDEEQRVLGLVGGAGQNFEGLSIKQLEKYHDEVDKLYGIDLHSPRFQEEITRKFGSERYPEAVLGGR